MPAIHAISTLVVFAWMPGSKGDLWSPSMQGRQGFALLWPGMTVVVPGHKAIRKAE
jgi:hypothetical protein